MFNYLLDNYLMIIITAFMLCVLTVDMNLCIYPPKNTLRVKEISQAKKRPDQDIDIHTWCGCGPVPSAGLGE